MSNQIQVIAPYWLHGTWVFDDPRTGLVQEPFVSSVPEMIDDLVSGIPNARHGIPSLVLSDDWRGFVKRWGGTGTKPISHRLRDGSARHCLNTSMKPRPSCS